MPQRFCAGHRPADPVALIAEPITTTLSFQGNSTSPFFFSNALRAVALSGLLAAPTISVAAETLDKATVQRAMITALDTCTSVIDGKGFNPAPLKALNFEINDTPTVPIVWFYPNDLASATVSKNATPRVIYEQYKKAPGCVIRMVKSDMSSSDLYKLLKATLKQRGWTHSLRNDSFTRGDTVFKLQRSSKSDLYAQFTLRAQS